MQGLAKLVWLALQVLLCAAMASLAWGDESLVEKTEIEKYEAQLNAVLHTRLDAEKAYVHDVVELVRVGRLPRKLVDKAATWVRNHIADDDYDFVYFERVLRLQAEKLRFKVPPFDFKIYNSPLR